LICMCGLAVYLYFDSLVWLAVDKQVQEGNNTVGFLFVSEFDTYGPTVPRSSVFY